MTKQDQNAAFAAAMQAQAAAIAKLAAAAEAQVAALGRIEALLQQLGRVTVGGIEDAAERFAVQFPHLIEQMQNNEEADRYRAAKRAGADGAQRGRLRA